jgi:hypothetical protein
VISQENVDPWDLLIVDALPLKLVHLTRRLTLTSYFGLLAFIR